MSFASQFPLVRVLLLFVCGILAVNYVQLEHASPLIYTVALLIAAILYFNRKKKFELTSALIVFIIPVLACIYTSRFKAFKTAAHPALDGEIAVIGQVQELTKRERGYHSFVVLLSKIKRETEWSKCTLSVEYKSQNDLNGISEGDIVYVKSAIKKFQSPLNPKQFNYRAFKENQGIHYYGFTSDIMVLDQSTNLKSLTTGIQQKFLNTFHKNGILNNELAVLKALTFGDKTALNRELKYSYVYAGAMHVLAVSGLHVGIIFLLFNWVLKPIPNTLILSWLKAVILMSILWFYAALTGLSPSVQRACLMFSLIILAKTINRNSNVINSIAGSALILLMINPDLIFDLGFQLSYSAVFGIVLFYPVVYNWFAFKYSLIDKIWSVTVVSVSATLATLPLVIYYFHQFPNFFFLTNLIVVPLAFTAVGGGMLVGLLEMIFQHDLFLSIPLQWALKLLNASVQLINEIPFAVTSNIWMSDLSLTILTTAIILLIVFIRKPHKTYAFAILLMLILLQLSDLIALVQQSKKNFIGVYAINGSPLVSVNGLSAEVISTNPLKGFDKKIIEDHLYSLRVKQIIWTTINKKNSDAIIHRQGLDVLILRQAKNYPFYRDELNNLFVINHTNQPNIEIQGEFIQAYKYSANADTNNLDGYSLRRHGYYQIDL